MTASAVSAGWILKTPKPSWDRHCRIQGEIGVLSPGSLAQLSGTCFNRPPHRLRQSFSVRGGELIDAVGGADDVRLTVSPPALLSLKAAGQVQRPPLPSAGPPSRPGPTPAEPSGYGQQSAA